MSGYKLKPEVKEAWVAALRSGNYRQVNGALLTTDYYGESERWCCLGVLHDVMSEEDWETQNLQQVTGRYKYGLRQVDVNGDSELRCGFLPPDEWRSYFEDPEPSQAAFARLNDNNYMTFPEIADVIERDY